jgi:hypothetical protein
LKLRWGVGEINLSRLDFLSSEVLMDINVLGATVEDRILGKGNRPLVITEDYCSRDCVELVWFDLG